MTIGGHLQYDGKTSTKTAGLETIKIHLNSTISTKNAKYVAADIGKFYTNSELDLLEYMRIHENPPQPKTIRNHQRIQCDKIR